jgi:putative transcriptional regulator
MVMIMKELRSVMNLSSYGKISINLKELIEEKGITRYRLAKLADTRFEVVEKWCSGTVERIDSDVLARFCYILDCEITDIIKYNI